MSRDPYSPPDAGVDDRVDVPPPPPLRWGRIAGATVGIWLVAGMAALVAAGIVHANDAATTYPETEPVRYLTSGIVAFFGYLLFLRRVPERRILHTVVVYVGMEVLDLVISLGGSGREWPRLSALLWDAVAPALVLAWRARSLPPA